MASQSDIIRALVPLAIFVEFSANDLPAVWRVFQVEPDRL